MHLCNVPLNCSLSFVRLEMVEGKLLKMFVLAWKTLLCKHDGQLVCEVETRLCIQSMYCQVSLKNSQFIQNKYQWKYVSMWDR